MLVISVSGRILAQAARREGTPARVIDRYGDLDTRAAAETLQVEPALGDRNAGPRLMAAIERFAPRAWGEPVVWGGGLEGQPALLEQLAEDRELLGNGADQVRQLTDPVAWSALLDRLGLPYPAIRLDPPPAGEDWLSKQTGASGGWHVRPADPGDDPQGRYFQRRAPGTPYSVLFAADGREAAILGFTEQWTGRAQTGDDRDFRYGGGLAHAPLPAMLRRRVTEAVETLTAAVGLRGLNGLDFVADGDRFQILEVNPRPVASLDLYREGLAPSPYGLHLAGSRGPLPQVAAEPPRCYRGHAVVYADRPLRLPPGLLANDWCGDQAPQGTEFPEGAPVCTVHARHADRERARRMLWMRHQRIREQLGPSPLTEPLYST